MKNQVIASILCATVLVGSVSPNFQAFAEETNSNETTHLVAYDMNYIEDMLKDLNNDFALALPYKEGNVELPLGYSYSVVTNPYTNQSFYKVERNITTYGLKKFAIVNAFRYGGKALGTVMDVVSPATAKYIKKNSGKIADAIDDAGAMIHGEIYQSLLDAKVPTTIARNIAWAIDAFLL